MNISHDEEGHKGRFFFKKEGQLLALMTYTRMSQSKIIVDHTEVDDSLRGTGAGKKLVEAGVNWARANGVKILPLCPFAKATIDRNPEFQDVL